MQGAHVTLTSSAMFWRIFRWTEALTWFCPVTSSDVNLQCQCKIKLKQSTKKDLQKLTVIICKQIANLIFALLPIVILNYKPFLDFKKLQIVLMWTSVTERDVSVRGAVGILYRSLAACTWNRNWQQSLDQTPSKTANAVLLTSIPRKPRLE